jgi:hypothetical protein
MNLMSRNGEGHVTPHVREVEKGIYMHRAGTVLQYIHRAGTVLQYMYRTVTVLQYIHRATVALLKAVCTPQGRIALIG